MSKEAAMTEPRDLRTLWQAQPPEGEAMSIDDVRHRARVLDRKIRQQDVIMTLSAIVNTSAFMAVMWYLPGLRLVSVIVIATVIVICVQYVRRRPSRNAIDFVTSNAADACAHFYRTMLLRKRDLAHQLWIWFMPPAIVGQVALIVGFLVAPPNVPRRLVLMALPLWILADVLIFTFGWRNARREAKKMETELKALDAMNRTS
jgi:hypothetical protein